MSLEYLGQHLGLANFQREDFSACHYHKRSLVSQCLGHTRVKFQGINCEESRSLQYLPDAKHCKLARSCGLSSDAKPSSICQDLVGEVHPQWNHS
jgi:hypothetical protein